MSADPTTAEKPIVRLRSCANCGTPSLGWWCSTACRREEDGDERDFDWPDDPEGDQ